ncbi:hypothetical protein BKA66DRAFT_3957 [Pyrenochaeta sp. MPI-SDFR-AT-0127]|nr:hypothetical protein BKA66DRAFT_3957 [Pyrenochaeta sp. MPI-SDFR-AT-0127]
MRYLLARPVRCQGVMVIYLGIVRVTCLRCGGASPDVDLSGTLWRQGSLTARLVRWDRPGKVVQRTKKIVRLGAALPTSCQVRMWAHRVHCPFAKHTHSLGLQTFYGEVGMVLAIAFSVSTLSRKHCEAQKLMHNIRIQQWMCTCHGTNPMQVSTMLNMFLHSSHCRYHYRCILKSESNARHTTCGVPAHCAYDLRDGVAIIASPVLH